MRMLILNNPRAAGWIIIAAVFVLGVVLAYVVFRLMFAWILKRRINQYSDFELDKKEKAIENLKEIVVDQDVEIVTLKAKLSKIAIFLGKAISEHGTLTND